MRRPAVFCCTISPGSAYRTVSGLQGCPSWTACICHQPGAHAFLSRFGFDSSQQEAAVKERELNEAKAIAAQQPALTASKVAIAVAENEGEAALKRKTKEAEALVKTAAAATQDHIGGQAEAARIQAIGAAEASATKAQSDALDGPDAALRRAIAGLLAEAIKNAKQPLVPGIVMGAAGQVSIADLLMSMAVANGSVGKLLTRESPAA
jgi:hypothetical protein